MKKILFLLLCFPIIGFGQCEYGDCENGEGSYTFSSGNKYTGVFKNKKLNGKGIFRWTGGALYIGDWKDNERHGQGTQSYADGHKYDGDWKDDERHGQGTMIWKEGNKYVGEYKDGNMQGEGTYTTTDGNKYVGEFKDGNMHGEGTYTSADGNKYVGEFKDSDWHGQGTMYYADGSFVKGLWENGKFIESNATKITGLKTNGQKIFDVINHPKSKGLNFSITEPAEFERVDGKRPNILYNWIKNRDDLTNKITISILIKELPEELQLTKEEWIEYLKFGRGVKDITEDLKNVNKEKYIVLESYPGVMFNCTSQTQRIDYERKTYNKQVTLFVQGKSFMITMLCSSASSLELNERIFISMINSIHFINLYK